MDQYRSSVWRKWADDEESRSRQENETSDINQPHKAELANVFDDSDGLSSEKRSAVKAETSPQQKHSISTISLKDIEAVEHSLAHYKVDTEPTLLDAAITVSDNVERLRPLIKLLMVPAVLVLIGAAINEGGAASAAAVPAAAVPALCTLLWGLLEGKKQGQSKADMKNQGGDHG